MNEEADRLLGPAGVALRVPDDRRTEGVAASGGGAATLDSWWLHLPGSPVVVAHGHQVADRALDVTGLEIIVPPSGEGMDTFCLSVITLADVPGEPPANLTFPWMTHELLVVTVDTSKGPVPFEAPFPWRWMQPHNVSVQFQVDNDDQARDLARDIAWAIVNGHLLAEIQAFVPEEHKMMTLAVLKDAWHGAVSATAEHHRTGGTHHEEVPRS